MSVDELLTRQSLESIGYEYKGCYDNCLIMTNERQSLLVTRTGKLFGSYTMNKPLKLRGLYEGIQLDLFYNKNGVDKR